MSDEEPDYMSDAFILESEQKDIRPGLIHNRSVKRTMEIYKRKQETEKQNKDKFKPLKVIEKEKLQGGLETPLSSTNKGFELLKKMGFKPGSGLGKTGEGRSDPITVEIKTNREGLGVKAHLEELRAAKLKKWKEAQEAAPSIEDYRARRIEKANEKQTEIDLFKSQRICHSLDTRENVSVPLEEYFWPPDNSEVQEEEEAEEEGENENDKQEEIPLSIQDKLEMLTVYLRRAYFYCIWCGINFDDEKDLRTDCPGPTRNDH